LSLRTATKTRIEGTAREPRKSTPGTNRRPSRETAPTAAKRRLQTPPQKAREQTGEEKVGWLHGKGGLGGKAKAIENSQHSRREKRGEYGLTMKVDWVK
jgi:hypothetical protein